MITLMKLKCCISAVILMEGGTEFDLKCLEKEYMTSQLTASQSSPSKGSTVVVTPKVTQDTSVTQVTSSSHHYASDLTDDDEDKVSKFKVKQSMML